MAGLEGYSGSSGKVDISAVECRSNDDTTDISISALSDLDITANASWASGTAPSLTSTTIYVWADNNSGTQRFILDDVTGSNLTDADKARRVGTFITDSSDSIIPFSKLGTGDEVITYYNGSVQDFSAVTTSYVDYDVSVPSDIEVEPIIKIIGDANTISSSYDGATDIIQGIYNIDLKLTTSTASVKLKTSSGTVGVGHILGYKEKR